MSEGGKQGWNGFDSSFNSFSHSAFSQLRTVLNKQVITTSLGYGAQYLCELYYTILINHYFIFFFHGCNIGYFRFS